MRSHQQGTLHCAIPLRTTNVNRSTSSFNTRTPRLASMKKSISRALPRPRSTSSLPCTLSSLNQTTASKSSSTTNRPRMAVSLRTSALPSTQTKRLMIPRTRSLKIGLSSPVFRTRMPLSPKIGMRKSHMSFQTRMLRSLMTGSRTRL
jgi:hypothetical protein